jgi:hypothetical protein
MFALPNAADQYLLAQGGQLYWAFPLWKWAFPLWKDSLLSISTPSKMALDMTFSIMILSKRTLSTPTFSITTLSTMTPSITTLGITPPRKKVKELLFVPRIVKLSVGI